MGAIHDYLFIEDIDLNAAAAQIAAAKSQLNCHLPDADTIKLPEMKGMYVTEIAHCDETAGGIDGYLEFLGRGSERKFRFGCNVLAGDLLVNRIPFKPQEFPLEPGQRIKAVGGKSGSGAEQHVVRVSVYLPDIDGPELYEGPVKHYHLLGGMTGTLVAATITGLNSILGDETALQDSEIQFATDPEKDYVLKGFYATPGGAGYGALGVRHSSGKYDAIDPAVFAAAVRAEFRELNWRFKGDAPHRLIGCGVGTTSTELSFILGEIN